MRSMKFINKQIYYPLFLRTIFFLQFSNSSSVKLLKIENRIFARNISLYQFDIYYFFQFSAAHYRHKTIEQMKIYPCQV